MIFFDRTTAVIEKTLKDLARISFIIAIVVQVSFLILYGYKIYVNLFDHPIYLIVYSTLAAVSIFGFIFFLVTYKNRGQKVVLGTNRIVRICKYLANATMIVVVLIEYTQKEVSDLEVVISGISIASFALQIVMEFIRILYEKYSELFKVALTKDLEKFNFEKKFFGAIGKPVEAIANAVNGTKKEEAEQTKAEIMVDQLTEEYRARNKETKTEKSKAVRQEFWGHFKRIFKRDKKEEPNKGENE